MPRAGATIPRPKPGVDPDSLPLFLSVDQLAEIMGVSRSAAHEACKRGQVKYIFIGRRMRIPRAALLSLGMGGEGR